MHITHKCCMHICIWIFENYKEYVAISKLNLMYHTYKRMHVGAKRYSVLTRKLLSSHKKNKMNKGTQIKSHIRDIFDFLQISYLLSKNKNLLEKNMYNFISISFSTKIMIISHKNLFIFQTLAILICFPL